MGSAIRRMRRGIERGRTTINASHEVTVEVLVCPGCFVPGVISPLRDHDTGAPTFTMVNDDDPCSKEDDLRRDRVLHGTGGW